MGHALRVHPGHDASRPPPVRRVRPAQAAGSGALFANVLGSSRPAGRRFGVGASVAAHAAVFGLLILGPILTHEDLPEHKDYVRALLYAPPPPPPLPPPKGTPLVRQTAPAKPETATAKPVKPALTLPGDLDKPQPPAGDARPPDIEAWGSPTGSDSGVLEGMEGGVEGGMVGGVPGGVIGGVIGGTGDIPAPVVDYDQPPRLIRQVKPVYPQPAFVHKIEGTVLVEILISASGRVVRARVVRSIPQLDAAALQAVRQWAFAPGMKNGRPVATLAQAPITFRIY